jgi:hypothetical protein
MLSYLHYLSSLLYAQRHLHTPSPASYQMHALHEDILQAGDSLYLSYLCRLRSMLYAIHDPIPAIAAHETMYEEKVKDLQDLLHTFLPPDRRINDDKRVYEQLMTMCMQPIAEMQGMGFIAITSHGVRRLMVTIEQLHVLRGHYQLLAQRIYAHLYSSSNSSSSLSTVYASLANGRMHALHLSACLHGLHDFPLQPALLQQFTWTCLLPSAAGQAHHLGLSSYYRYGGHKRVYWQQGSESIEGIYAVFAEILQVVADIKHQRQREAGQKRACHPPPSDHSNQTPRPPLADWVVFAEGVQLSSWSSEHIQRLLRYLEHLFAAHPTTCQHVPILWRIFLQLQRHHTGGASEKLLYRALHRAGHAKRVYLDCIECLASKGPGSKKDLSSIAQVMEGRGICLRA